MFYGQKQKLCVCLLLCPILGIPLLSFIEHVRNRREKFTGRRKKETMKIKYKLLQGKKALERVWLEQL
jgi:hypothetical protein